MAKAVAAKSMNATALLPILFINRISISILHKAAYVNSFMILRSFNYIKRTVY